MLQIKPMALPPRFQVQQAAAKQYAQWAHAVQQQRGASAAATARVGPGLVNGAAAASGISQEDAVRRQQTMAAKKRAHFLHCVYSHPATSWICLASVLAPWCGCCPGSRAERPGRSARQLPPILE